MSNKVLVIDDDADICELVRRALESKGINVISATTGEEGIKAAGEFGPDVILLDHRLPDMDGLDTAKKIKATAAGKNVSIVLMSGVDSVAAEYKVEPGLVVGYLIKPFRLADMTDYVKKIMGK